MVFLKVAYDVYLLKHLSYYFAYLKYFLARGKLGLSFQNFHPRP